MVNDKSRGGIVCVGPSGLTLDGLAHLGFHLLRSFHPRLFCVTASRFSWVCYVMAPGVSFATLISPQAILCHRFAVLSGLLYDGKFLGSLFMLTITQARSPCGLP